FVICNMRTGDAYYWRKRKGQIYIQTWHSSIRLKKIEKDAEQCFDSKYIESAKDDSAKTDLILSGCDFSTEIFSNSFWYNGEIMKSGTPRCDILFNNTEETKKKVFDYYGVNPDNRIVIYAPTFRKDKSADLHGIDADRISAALKKAFGGEWTFMYRFHPNIIKDYSSDVKNTVDASKYPDMQELIATADFMITDYSSCMFDMLIAGKSCILYAPDAEEYSKDERGLYFDFDELPFPMAKTNEQLESEILCFDSEKYRAKSKSFMRKIGSYETGHASEKVAEYIKEVIDERKKSKNV
ncbi:MAG: CDP-glycerol glycerophosphotransferase family protein, partial [Eubacterium sp.]